MYDSLAISEVEAREIAHVLTLIRPAQNLPHRNGTLFSHLVGTWRILTASGADGAVTLAGLVHSVYSTQYYKTAIFASHERALVRDTLGDAAEGLVHLFCSIDHAEFWRQRGSVSFPDLMVVRERAGGAALTIDGATAEKLLVLLCANYAEQCADADGFPRPFLAWGISLAPRGVGLFTRPPIVEKDFTESREVEAIDSYRTAAGLRNLPDSQIDSLVALNPYAPEIAILATVNELARGNPAAARRWIDRARQLYRFWGTPWDKRVPYLSWLGIVDDLEAVAQNDEGFHAGSAGAQAREIWMGLFSRD